MDGDGTPADICSAPGETGSATGGGGAGGAISIGVSGWEGVSVDCGWSASCSGATLVSRASSHGPDGSASRPCDWRFRLAGLAPQGAGPTAADSCSVGPPPAGPCLPTYVPYFFRPMPNSPSLVTMSWPAVAGLTFFSM
jgi:hypothetical protein